MTATPGSRLHDDSPRQASPVAAFWALDAQEVLRRLDVAESGLSSGAVNDRRERFGPNRLAPPRRAGRIATLGKQFTDPIVLILVGACGLSIVLRDVADAAIIIAIVLLSGLLGFWQERRATIAVQRLLELVRVHADIRRDGAKVEVALEDVVPGDILLLHAGDVVPCDCRLLRATDLQIDQAPLTGETFPRHKHPDPAPADAPLADRHSALFFGSHVVSGRGEAVAVATGPGTELGRLSRRVEQTAPRTGFEHGVRRFGLLLARVTSALALVIFAVNLLLRRPFADSMLFSLALAVGMTPQLLPVIVTVSLSTGARRMARKRVIVRRLDAIEDFGAMDVLCTDKTGTITEGAVRLSAALDASGTESDSVVSLAALNAGLQAGFANPIDQAILAPHTPDPRYRAVDEVPFDFNRKRLSVLVSGPEGQMLITKGAFSSVLGACTSVLHPNGLVALEQVRADLDKRFRELSDAGYRILAVARRELTGVDRVTVADERELTFVGFLSFADPAKEGVDRELGELRALGISVRMITGDNRYAAAHIAGGVGLDATRLLTARDIERMDDRQLVHAAAQTEVFAEVEPLHKERILQALRTGGAIVGYMGDGINDAGALHIADVGISVDTAVDVAKSAASIVLLDKDLAVLTDGVRLGRQTFTNTLKYVFTTVSANFGNVASMAAASAFLPFLPLLPRQILLLNFLSDIPSTMLAADRVDREQAQRPQRWDIRFIGDFMIVFGLLSSAFDLLTFAVLLHLFHAGATTFRSGWFVGSTLTELAVLFVLRTRRPALKSRSGTGLLVTSVVVAAITVSLPYTPLLAEPLALEALSARLLASLALITLLYVASAELIKPRFYRAMQRPRAEGQRHERHPRHLAGVVREHGGLDTRAKSLR